MDETRVVGLIHIEIFFYLRRHGFVDDFEDKFARLLGIDHFVAVGVNDLALHVHHIIEIESPFSDKVVALLDTFLRRLDRFI